MIINVLLFNTITRQRIILSFQFQCQCELPESYEAYRKQQHRWHSGPMQLFRLCLPAVIRSKVIDLVNTVLLEFAVPHSHTIYMHTHICVAVFGVSSFGGVFGRKI